MYDVLHYDKDGRLSKPPTTDQQPTTDQPTSVAPTTDQPTTDQKNRPQTNRPPTKEKIKCALPYIFKIFDIFCN